MRLFSARKWSLISVLSILLFELSVRTILAGNIEHSLAKHAEEDGLGLIYKQDYRGAIKALDQAISLDPEYALAYSFRALAYLKLANYQKTIDDSTTAIKLDRRLWTPYCWRSEAYEKLGQPQKAINEFTTAIGIDPNNISAYLARGDLYAKQSSYQRAVDDYSKMIDLNPKHRDTSLPWAYVYYQRSQAYHNLGKEDLEKSDLKEATALGYKQVLSK